MRIWVSTLLAVASCVAALGIARADERASVTGKVMREAALVGRRFHFSRRSPGQGWNGRIAMLLRSSRFAAGVLLVLATQAFADTPISIQYTLVPLGGNVGQYVYSIQNNGTLPGAAAVKLFDIFFDSSLYQKSSLQIVTPSSLQSQWSEVLLTVIPPVIPAEYDAYALQGGIPVGNTVTGFSVKFTWLGPGVPGAQVFQISDPSTFQVLQTGQTVLDRQKARLFIKLRAFDG